MSVTLLVAGVATERLKIEAKRQADRIVSGYHDWIANLPDDTATAECTGNLICQREGVRHKVGCLGKTIPFDVYAKALQDVE